MMEDGRRSPPPRLLIAGWVAPMDQPVIRDGGVLIAGERIAALGRADALKKAHPQASVEDLGSTLLTPGLVNAHTHLELSHRTAGERPAGFADWLKRVAPTPGGPPDIAQAVADGVAQCLRFGVTAVGDISAFPSITRAELARHPLRAVSYGEIRAMAGRRRLLDERLRSAADPSFASDRLRIGLSPHAPYSVEPVGYRRCLELSRRQNMPLATHLAESPDECDFLAHHAGPFRDLWSALGGWDDAVPTFAGGPIRFAQSLGLLDHSALLAHVNYCDDEELNLLANGRASVVYCPRTHAYFGHPPHRWREMLERGINVAVGTDSLASNPDLSVLEELRTLRKLAPEVDPETIWRMGTINAATAIESSDRIGSLTLGKEADLAAFPIDSSDPLEAILRQRIIPRNVWISGEEVV